MPNVWRLWLVRPEIDCAGYREHVTDSLKKILTRYLGRGEERRKPDSRLEKRMHICYYALHWGIGFLSS